MYRYNKANVRLVPSLLWSSNGLKPREKGKLLEIFKTRILSHCKKVPAFCEGAFHVFLMDSGLGSVPFQAFNFPLMKSCFGVVVLQYTSVMLILLYTSLQFFKIYFECNSSTTKRDKTRHWCPCIDDGFSSAPWYSQCLRYSFITLSWLVLFHCLAVSLLTLCGPWLSQ